MPARSGGIERCETLQEGEGGLREETGGHMGSPGAPPLCPSPPPNAQNPPPPSHALCRGLGPALG